MSGSALERIRQAAKRLKVFPLPSVVLFPGSAAPLHIFEPRYRQMVKDALESDGVFALGQLQEGWERDYLGRPPLMPILCAGPTFAPPPLPTAVPYSFSRASQIGLPSSCNRSQI